MTKELRDAPHLPRIAAKQVFVFNHWLKESVEDKRDGAGRHQTGQDQTYSR